MRILSPKFARNKLASKMGKGNDSSSYNSSFDDTPSVAESEVSSVDYSLDDEFRYQNGLSSLEQEKREPLAWVFKGLTLWIEFEEHDQDLSQAIDGASKFYGTERIPMPHSTAIYGMTHLSHEEAVEKLATVAEAFPNGWPAVMDRPISVKQDIAVEGRPGQVCSIAWAELTLKSNDEHEEAIDKLHEIFGVKRASDAQWCPHISLAYDNPEDHVLSLTDTISYVAQNPSLMEARKIKAVSLWSTEGKMADWKCLDRVSFF